MARTKCAETLCEAIGRLSSVGYKDFLVDRCGLWSKQTDTVHRQLKNTTVDWIDTNFDDGEGTICYIQLEHTKYPTRRCK